MLTMAQQKCKRMAVETPEHLTAEWTQCMAKGLHSMAKEKHEWKLAVVQWRSHVVDLMTDLDDMLAARGREVSAVPALQFQ